MMDVKQIGNNILEELSRKGITQVELAKGLNTSKQIINKIIKGKKAIKMEELVKISEFLKVSLTELIDGTHNPEVIEVGAIHLNGEIKNTETVEFILNLVENLSLMEEELSEHGLL